MHVRHAYCSPRSDLRDVVAESRPHFFVGLVGGAQANQWGQRTPS